MSGGIDFRLSGPIYGIAQREAVELAGETLVVTDPGFLLTMEITADLMDVRALLLYTKREYAAEFLASREDPSYVAATFRSAPELVTHLEDSRWPWVMLNRIPGKHDGSIIRGRDFVENLKRWMALG
jgi:hypothetical protein